MNIINLTPHALSLPTVTIPPAGEVARVLTMHRTTDHVSHADAVVDIATTDWGRIVHLPDPQPGVGLVVSNVVVAAAHAQGRDIDDLYVPGEQRRDAQGRIVGCESITPGRTSLPGEWLGLHAPVVAIHGSVLTDTASTPAKDIDAVYAGMDHYDAVHIVWRWAEDHGRRGLPLDVRCAPSAKGPGVDVPAPAALPGESLDGPSPSVPVAQIFGDAPVRLRHILSVGSIFRRAGTLHAAGLAPDVLARLLAERFRTAKLGLPMVCDGNADGIVDDYSQGSLGGARRAFARLGGLGPELLAMVAGRGLPRLVQALTTVLDPEWVPSAAVRKRLQGGAPWGSGLISRECGVLYVSSAGVGPGYPEGHELDPDWLVS